MRDALSRTLDILANNIWTPNNALCAVRLALPDEMYANYDADQFFASFAFAIQGKLPADEINIIESANSFHILI